MKDPLAKRHAEWKLEEFRDQFPELRLIHQRDGGLNFQGRLTFRAVKEGFVEIEDTFSIRGVIPSRYPAEYAMMYETGGRIPSNYHRLDNGSLCLGSDLRIKMETFEDSSLPGLMHRLLIPYLYNFCCYERGIKLPVGELGHGSPGLIQDYEDLFNLKGERQCLEALRLLGMKKRIANKMPCSCGGGKRLGKCHCRILNPLRKIAPRSFFIRHAKTIAKNIKADSKTFIAAKKFSPHFH